MTVGSDNLIKIYHYDNKDHPLLVVECTDEVVTDCCFVEDCYNIIALCTAEGSVRIFNLAESIEKPKETIVIPKTGLDSLTAIKSSLSQRALAVVSKLGGLWILSLGGDLKDDQFLLDKIYTY